MVVVWEEVYAYFDINTQGDEPLIDINSIRKIVKEIVDCGDIEVQVINAYVSLSDPSYVVNSNAVALLRQSITYPMSGKTRYYQQLGLYTFKKMRYKYFHKGNLNF